MVFREREPRILIEENKIIALMPRGHGDWQYNVRVPCKSVKDAERYIKHHGNKRYVKEEEQCEMPILRTI